jgi:hypothetical protein
MWPGTRTNPTEMFFATSCAQNKFQTDLHISNPRIRENPGKRPAMYQLAKTEAYWYPGRETYVLDILPVATGFAATASDQTLGLFDPRRLSQGPVKTIRTDHGNLTAAKVYSAADSVICTAGENGIVSVWDLRLDPSNARALQIGGVCSLLPIQPKPYL